MRFQSMSDYRTRLVQFLEGIAKMQEEQKSSPGHVDNLRGLCRYIETLPDSDPLLQALASQNAAFGSEKVSIAWGMYTERWLGETLRENPEYMDDTRSFLKAMVKYARRDLEQHRELVEDHPDASFGSE